MNSKHKFILFRVELGKCLTSLILVSMSRLWVTSQLEALSALMMSCDIKSLTWYRQLFGQMNLFTGVTQYHFFVLIFSYKQKTTTDQFTMQNFVNMSSYKRICCKLLDVLVWNSKLANFFYKEMHVKGQVWPSAIHFFVKNCYTI